MARVGDLDKLCSLEAEVAAIKAPFLFDLEEEGVGGGGFGFVFWNARVAPLRAAPEVLLASWWREGEGDVVSSLAWLGVPGTLMSATRRRRQGGIASKRKGEAEVVSREESFVALSLWSIKSINQLINVH